MAKATRNASAEPARTLTSEELRRAALARSARRGAGVASRRLARRWVLWVFGQLLKWGSLPALAAAGFFWWQQQPKPAAPSPQPRSASAPSHPASAPASAASAVRLRLDRADAQSPP